ncbi:MAG: hypothetical protein KF893_15140 [Caldilineaceae bacterium]|nr:hypothetical protein [Caldilineaceae bacterium]
MAGSGVRWTIVDRDGHEIYLTQERWEHILEPTNHPEMEDFEEELKQTIQQSRRKQDPLNSQKYTYTKAFRKLVLDNTHIIAVVLFRFRERGNQPPMANNYIVTAYQKEIS